MKKLFVLLVVGIFLASTIAMAGTHKVKNEVTNEDTDECECNFLDKYEGYEFPPKSDFALSLMDPDPQMTVSADDLPSQFSWLDYGGDWTTVAKAQGNCGSCWDFGALGALEAAINIASGYPTTDLDLSEQYVLSCLSAAGSCGGGWMSEAIAYIKSESPGSAGNGINGVPKESCMPYQGVDYIPCDSKCDNWDVYNDPPEPDDMLWQVKDFGVTSGSEDDPAYWDLMKTWCYTHGPIVVDIYVGGWGSYWNSHHSPTDVYEHDDSGITNHAQVLCGWVDDPDILNGGYWIIKNSWGQGFGYNGFSNIAYGCNSLGTRDVTWVTAMDWPEEISGPGPVDVDMAVFAKFDYGTENGNSKYPHLGEVIEFRDTSEGDVALREWDFNGDGVIDSNKKNPEHIYTKEDEYIVNLTVHSEWGTHSTLTKKVEVREIWPPVAVCTPSEYPDPDHPDNDLEIHFDARYSHDRDEGTITGYHWDFDDGTTSDYQYLNHEFPEGDRQYNVILTVTDNDGASESVICEVKIDVNIPPETTILHDFDSTGTEWYKETQRIHFEATDWTRVINTFYRYDGGSWVTYHPLEQYYIPIGGEGLHTVECYSVDYYGNEEDVKSETFGIDNSDPTIQVSVSGSMMDDIYTPPVTVSVSGDDSLSGVESIQYRYGASGWMEYTGPVTFEDPGYYRFEAFVYDKAGNSAYESVDVVMDHAPVKPLIKSGPTQGVPNKDYTFEFSTFDPEGDDVSYLVDWGDGSDSGWLGPYSSGETASASHSWDSMDTFYVKVMARDKYGMESEWSESQGVRMPKIKTFVMFNVFLEKHPILQFLLGLYLNLGR